MVMYAGRIVEQGDVLMVLGKPHMPYTMGLIRSVPRLDWTSEAHAPLEAIPGTVPDPLHLPPGCSFEPRCRFAEPERCNAAVPPLETTEQAHLVRCVRWREIENGITP